MDRAIAFAGFGLAALVFAIALYEQGVLRFAYPGEEDYPVRGIDVSHHQGDIRWQDVAADGIAFAYIKATEGGDWKEVDFARNLAGARAAGIATGAYHFFTLCRPGAEQADNFIASVPAGLELPPAIDLEFIGNCSARPGPDDPGRELRTFIDAIEAHYGVAPVLYTMRDFHSLYLADEGLEAYPLWYRDLFFTPDLPEDHTAMFWQFANRGRVAGIDGPVDLNVFMGSEAEFAADFPALRDR